MTEKYLTRAEVAERFQITEEEVAEFEALHRIPVLRIAKAVRYDANALAAFEAAARGAEPAEPTPPPQPNPPPEVTAIQTGLFDLAEAMTRLACGRTFLLGHLAKHPLHAGQPTHRRVGKKIMFTAADFERLVATMAGDLSPVVQRRTRGPAVTEPSHAEISRRLKKRWAEAKARGRKPRQG